MIKCFNLLSSQYKLERSWRHKKEKLNLLERNRKYWYDIRHNPNHIRKDFTFVVVIFLYIR